MSTALVLFRNDLRLADNPALAAACAAHENVIPVYLHETETGATDPAAVEKTTWRPGAASQWWLHHSLNALDRSLREQGGSLHIAAGDPQRQLLTLVHASGAAAVHWNRRYEPAAIARDTSLKTALRHEGIATYSHAGNLWLEPWAVTAASGQPYRVFTPFWRKLRSQLPPAAPLAPARPAQWARVPDSVPIAALDLLPKARWDTGLAKHWQPGEVGAAELLEIFADDAAFGYAERRDLPGRHGTSRLSPHLHFGEITPTQIHRFLLDHAARPDARQRPDIEPFLRQLGWREFAHHLLFHFPHAPEANFNPQFDNFAWATPDEALLERWQRGRTGIPLVDAGMRELWHTGWMHNRVRMVVASFLTKNLRQHWLHGARWFWDTLVDADLANNTLGWQWVAGCGADAAPYFRVFNPYRQAAKFDPDGAYIKRWLPELGALPARLLHEPWRDPGALDSLGYPPAMVDLAASRDSALSAWASIRDR